MVLYSHKIKAPLKLEKNLHKKKAYVKEKHIQNEHGLQTRIAYK